MATSPTGPLPPADDLLSAARRNLRELAHGLSHASHPSTPLLAHAPKLWQRLLPYVVVLALAATFIPVTITVLTTRYGVPGALAGALGVAQAAPLLMLAHRPLQAWWIIFPADILGALVLLVQPADPSDVWPWTPPATVAYLFLLLALGLRETRRTVIAVWAVTGAAGAVLHLIAPDRGSGSALLLTILGGVVLVIGGAVRERGVAQRRLAEQETISEAERAQRTLLEERTRIARELHDVVAHHMSVITVQADSAPYRISGLPKAAEEEFTAIAAAARESLGEMRRLLSVLRSEGTEGDRAPQPGLDRLQQLVEATVRAGLPAELALSAELSSGRGEVPPAVDLSAYRIVQEALANVVRHAPGARTRVLVAPDNGHLLVLVVNGPAAAPGSPLETSGTGHGLVGMRERVRLTGGTLDTGPLPDGGFRVAARMPLPPATATPAAPPTPLPPEDL
ncbi:sensor histidine kinase [Streptomyces sp. ISL-112]|uniref:sensor histidine kinase n=1 Tax=unclassified Streptomyces TaxID=2593676 RepID=UPI001BEB8065|nr:MULTISPECIES: sensor histidine kinase [unclassified Streptomyces]MBT2429189.1 sensor histidine kinase [Streptomyces sp. ISL-112]MBT2463519.1 sensor histidine kinase [Streptomyces sp. ISL-63]